ncbi:hypothetical protein C9J01_01990 [Photobacterium rosenbergii]|uniref:O-antigen ligase-related domain-containing protein n=1 Tax=Photobacterium rosenbergii TaxID=294936 RepID=A0A2T3NK09_9GAMM|nr:O-antigen ligase family protein [Photobacterium rosenbergii]PSW15810.1 hypothetical protein C9J01_01990 [Photobacterium rosenbergii]
MLQKSTLDNILLFFVFVGVIYFSLNFNFSKSDIFLLYDSKRFYVITLILLSSLFILLNSKVRTSAINDIQSLSLWVKGVLLLLLSGVLISSINSENYLYTLNYNLYYLGLFFLLCLMYQVLKKKKTGLYHLYAIISVLLFLSVAIAFWILVFLDLKVNIHTILSFSNPRFLNQVQVWLIIPLLYLAVLNKKRNKTNILVSISLVVNVATIIATDARGISIAICATILLWIILDKSWRYLIIREALKYLIAGIIVKLAFLAPLPSYVFSDGLLDFGSIRTDSPGRFQLWKDSISLINVWGQGGGYFICTSEYNFSPRYGHPHNSLLQIFIDWGIVTLIAYCFLLSTVLFAVIVTKRRNLRITGLALLAGFAYSFVSGVLVMPLSQLFAVLSIAIYWRCCSISVQPPKEYSQKAISTLFKVISIMIIFSLLYRGVERVDFYRSGILNNELFEKQRTYTEFWLGYNCNIDSL